MDPQGLSELIANFRERYDRVVKPALEKRDYSMAYLTVLDMWGEIRVKGMSPQIRQYRSGANFLITLLCLEAKLERLAANREEDVSYSTKRFLEELSSFEVSVRNKVFAHSPISL